MTVSNPPTGYVFLEKKKVPSRFKLIHQLCQDELTGCLHSLHVDPELSLIEVSQFSEIKNVRGGPPVYFRSSTIYHLRGPGKPSVVRGILTQKVTLIHPNQLTIHTASLGRSPSNHT